MQTYGEKLTDQQEVLTLAADIIIDVFAAESVLLRAAAAGRRADAGIACRAQVYISDAAGRVEIAARTALAAMAEGDTLANAARGAAAAAKVRAGQHRRAAPADRRRDARSARIICLIGSLA